MNIRGQHKSRTGVVVSNAMDKTVTVEIVRRVKHPSYGKYLKRRNRLHAHDEANLCKVGDTVRVVESRPLSKTKRWRVVETIVHAPEI